MSQRADRIGCPQFRALLRRERRAFVKAGILSATGLCMSDLLRLEARAASQGVSAPTSSPKRLNSAIILWMRGGPSQHETWDPKPDAPIDYRGAFGSMKTKVPGIHICDLLPMSAACMDKWSIIRSVHHHDAGHSAGDQICFTGYNAGRNPDANIHPSCGSIVAKQLQHQNPNLPAYVVIPRQVPGTDSAYLGPAYRPFETLADPVSDGPFKMQNFALPDGISYDRVAGRLQLNRDLDRMQRGLDQSGMMDAMDEFQQRAWDIVSGPAARAAFDLDAEPRDVRERYGFMPEYKAPTPDRCGVPAWSQRILLARRLVEAGVRLVTVDVRWWDTHVQGVETMRDGFLPRWDRAFSALIEDLDQRGLLKTTMVLAWGEFGRTPKMNAQSGRDHYPNVFSAAIAGGPIQGGRVVGSSDDKGALPKDRPTTPQDVLATLYKHLGVDIDAHYTDPSGRPIRVLPHGDPIRELL
jgi:hypothetical protein